MTAQRLCYKKRSLRSGFLFIISFIVFYLSSLHVSQRSLKLQLSFNRFADCNPQFSASGNIFETHICELDEWQSSFCFACTFCFSHSSVLTAALKPLLTNLKLNIFPCFVWRHSINTHSCLLELILSNIIYLR